MLELVPQPTGKSDEELDPKEELQNSIASHRGIIIQSIVETVCKPEFILKVNLCLYNGSEIFFNWDGVKICLQKQPEETKIKCEVSEIAVKLHDLIAETQDISTFQEAG
jgi:hypothetical protein